MSRWSRSPRPSRNLCRSRPRCARDADDTHPCRTWLHFETNYVFVEHGCRRSYRGDGVGNSLGVSAAGTTGPRGGVPIVWLNTRALYS
jgi:hypothetical protein